MASSGRGDLSARIHVPGEEDRFGRALEALAAECKRIGRNVGDVEITTGAHRPTADLLRQLEDMGVSRVLVPSPPVSRLRSRLEPLGELLR